MELPEPVPGLRAPFAVLSGEALDYARFAQRHWEPRLTKSGKTARPGLSSAVGTGLLTANIVTEIVDLLQAFQTAQTHYSLTVDPSLSGGASPLRHQRVQGDLAMVLR